MILATNPYLFFSFIPSLPSPHRKIEFTDGENFENETSYETGNRVFYAIVWRDESVEKTIITISERGVYG